MGPTKSYYPIIQTPIPPLGEIQIGQLGNPYTRKDPKANSQESPAPGRAAPNGPPRLRLSVWSGWKGSHLTQQVGLCLSTPTFKHSLILKFPKPTPGITNSRELELIFARAHALASPKTESSNSSTMQSIPVQVEERTIK